MSDEPIRYFDDLPGEDLPEDDVVYEDFEDVIWTEPDDLDVIDLDALDDAIPTADDAEPDPSADSATEDLFDTMDTLDDAIPATDDAPPGDAPEAGDVESAADTDRAAVDAADAAADAVTDTAADAVADAADSTAEDEPDEPADSGDEQDAPSVEASAEAVTEVDETPVEESSADTLAPDAAPSSAQRGPWVDAADEHPPDEAPAPPDYIYDVLLALPPDLGAQVLELRTTGEINDMPPPGVALHAAFRTTDRDALDAALANWTRAHLPIQIELTGIEAEINGTQQYIAAWTLDPLEELQDAQHDLRRTLATLAKPLPDAPVRRHVHVIIGDRVKPRRYPHVIGQMQRDYEPYVWHASELLLVQRDASAAPDEWEIERAFD